MGTFIKKKVSEELVARDVGKQNNRCLWRMGGEREGETYK